MSAQASKLVPLLLAAKADPQAVNASGQRANCGRILQQLSLAATESPGRSSVRGGATVPLYHLIRAQGAERKPDSGLLSYTLSMLQPPLRDSLGIARNAVAKANAQLNETEEEVGVWSCWVTNFTHADLPGALDTDNAETHPLSPHRSRQALVLTSERLVFLNARTWKSGQVFPLSEIAEVGIARYSASVLLLRFHGKSDLVLDVPSSSRRRLVDEIDFAVKSMSRRWGGHEFGEQLRVVEEQEQVSSLCDRTKQRVGTLAWLEVDVFLLIPWEPHSVFLGQGQNLIFGCLDLHHEEVAAHWAWQTLFFMLKYQGEPRLMWCKHPNDKEPAGCVALKLLQAVQPLDTPQGEACLILDHRTDGRAQTSTIRASSVSARDVWISSIREVRADAERKRAGRS